MKYLLSTLFELHSVSHSVQSGRRKGPKLINFYLKYVLLSDDVCYGNFYLRLSFENLYLYAVILMLFRRKINPQKWAVEIKRFIS